MIRRLAAAVALGFACSTVAPDKLVSCNKDEDCPPDELCQNGECYANTLPPPGQIGLDVTVEAVKGIFRVELTGSDRIVERIFNQDPTRFRVHLNNARPDVKDDPIIPGVRDKLSLAVLERTLVGNELKESPVRAVLELEQASRLRRDPVTGGDTYAPFDAMMNVVQNPEVVLQWPRYDPADSDAPLHLTIRPDQSMEFNDTILRGPIHRELVRKQLGQASTQVFEIPTRRECHRKLVANVIVGDMLALESRVSVEFVHTHSAPDPGKSVCDPLTDVQAVCAPSTIYPNELPPCTTANDCPAPYGCYPAGTAKKCGCDGDDECLTDQICDLASHRCALDLAGMSATNGAVPNTPDTTTIDAWVYTYCDEDVDADREMAFILRASSVGLDPDPDDMIPPPLSRLPPLSFDVAVNVLASQENTLKLPGNLCFPAWEAPRSLTLDLSHEPREVFRDEMDRPWTCCSTDCLAMKLDEPPPAPGSCPVVGSLTARTHYVPDPLLKAKNNCLALTALDPNDEPDTQWIAMGGKVQLGSCVDGGGNSIPCTISLSSGEDTREYELRLEPPVGSIVRSTLYKATVDPNIDALPGPEDLAYRVVLRGNVALEIAPPDGDEEDESLCSDITNCLVKAEVLAERIRVPGEDPATVLGPYFYATRTLDGSTTGEFVLPVNPGVYLLTALPAISSPGGPAKIAVVDLRLDSKLVSTAGKIPTATLKDPILLSEKGQFVVFELADFDPASVATPFDLGSWTGLSFEGRELDLNDPTTCHGDPGRACSIRRLRAGNSGLALTQEQFVKFITRAP